VLTTGTPQAKRKVQPELLGTTPRRGGATQVTYAGHPLYFYANSGKNQVLCHNIEEYGGRWLSSSPTENQPRTRAGPAGGRRAPMVATT
jgi:hypothetical protein